MDNSTAPSLHFWQNNSQIQSIFKNTLGFKFDQNNFLNARTYVLVLCENKKLLLFQYSDGTIKQLLTSHLLAGDSRNPIGVRHNI